jgi:UDP-glucuronate 4-epimerase
MKIMVTGAAGFIGSHLCARLCRDGHEVFAVDSLNSYYSVRLKKDRLKNLRQHKRFIFHRIDIADRKGVERVFKRHSFDRVVNLAAQAGVRYSLVNPHAYVQANVMGFLNILEGCRHSRVKHCLYASSSSVYGANSRLPFSTSDRCDDPLSLYAATKRSDEMMAHSYSHLFGLPTTGLRFFTVYGPWGRPDMALFLFTRAILRGEEIQVFNNGDMLRDFTYVDDVVESLVRIMDRVPRTCDRNESYAGDGTCTAPFALYNVGNSNPVTLGNFIAAVEKATGRKALRKNLGMQAGDVKATFADVDPLVRDFGFRPQTPIEEGVKRFVDWYSEYYSRQDR